MVKKGVSIVAGLMLLLCTTYAQEKRLTVKVTNPSGLARESETISIPWDSLKSLLSPDHPQFLAVTEFGSKTELRSQVFDENRDDSPDCFLFQSDFKPHESRTFVITTTNQPQPAVSLVDAGYVEPREDLAWENDCIAFRMYGPALASGVNNGIDVWTKRVRYLVVKKWYAGEEQTPKIVYHIDHGEGADFFNVGKSLGCGGSGVWFNDKVYQPGVFSSYKIIATGPIRTCFELSYDTWNVEGRKFKEIKRISLDAGQNLNRIDVTYKNAEYSELTSVACGLVKRPHTTWYKNEEHHWMSLWGLTTDSTVNGYLGTGVVFPPAAFRGWSQDSSQFLEIGTTDGTSGFAYYAGAGWTRSGDFKSVDDWNGYLDRFAVNLASPLQVSILHGQ